ncbi:MAG: aldehyde ferredoxin oxidoreductase N-terminal domain-containing protein [Thermodesulfobacteriota bacterium]
MAEMKFHLLEINLSTGKKEVRDVTSEMRKFIGGRGMGAKIMWDRVPENADPLGPENILYFGVGPITGFLGSVVNVSAKSPLTLRGGTSNVNGHLGVELIYAGYNGGLLLTGKASKPSYVYIKDGTVEIRDATYLWGKYNVVAQQMLREGLRKELDDQNFRVASIGPAGEHLVRNAGISHDFYHHAARMGMGAVMGSKNIKAIAVRGTRPPSYPDPAGLLQLLTKWYHGGRLKKAQDRRWGHNISIARRYYATTEGVKNKQLGWDPICDRTNSLILEQQYKVWNDGCNLCHSGCKVPSMRREPPLGPTVGELRHDNAGGWNANVMLPGFDVQIYLTPFVDELGFDSEDVSGVVAWMMECYQRGLITREDLGGIDLTWGNLPAICKLLKKIAYRKGIGDLLADGLKIAPLKIGKGTEKYAITGKGVAITSYEPRGSIQDAIDLAVVPVGELHGARGGPQWMAADGLTTCGFLIRPLQEVFGWDNFAVQFLRAATGWDLSKEDWKDMVRRLRFMERCNCIRDGYVPTRDDIMPDRFFEETIYNKYGQPKILNRKEFQELREKTYLTFELTPQGIPSRDLLKKLDMDFVIPAIEKQIGRW